MYQIFSNSILFYYGTDMLFDRVQMYSQLALSGIGEKQKTDQNVEKLIITPSDSDFFHREATFAVKVAFDHIYKLAKGVSSSVFLNKQMALPNVDSTPPGPGPFAGYFYGFYIFDRHGRNEHIFWVVDSYIQQLIENNILRSWYMVTRQFDLYKIADQNNTRLTIAYINSLYELYKPLIYNNELEAEYSVTIITVNSSGVETVGATTGTGVPDPIVPTDQVVYLDSYANRPQPGVEQVIYVDMQTNSMYRWNGTDYVPYDAPANEYTLAFTGVNVVIANHNLGKFMPTVTAIDSGGNEFSVEKVPIDINTTLVQWIPLKTGTLYFS